MKGRNLAILLILAVILSVTAFIVSIKSEKGAPSLEGRKVFNDLPLSEIKRIVISTSTKTAELARAENQWVAASKYDYPVNTADIRDLMLTINDLKIGQLVNIQENRKPEIRMTPPGKNTQNSGTKLEMFTDNAKPLTSLLIGSEMTQSDDDSTGRKGYSLGRYVSPDNGKTVYLVAESLNSVSTDEKDWFKTQIIHVPSSDVVKALIKQADIELVTLVLDKKEENLVPADMPENMEADTTETYGVRSALSYLRFDDIADPSKTKDEMGLDKPDVLELQTEPGAVYTARIGAVADKATGSRYIDFDVRLMPEEKTDNQEPSDERSEEQAQETEKSRKELEKQIHDLKQKLEKWTYIVSKYKIDSMLKSSGDLLKEKKEETETTGAAAENEEAGEDN